MGEKEHSESEFTGREDEYKLKLSLKIHKMNYLFTVNVWSWRIANARSERKRKRLIWDFPVKTSLSVNKLEIRPAWGSNSDLHLSRVCHILGNTKYNLIT